MGLYLGSNKLNVNLGNDGLLANYYVSAQSQEKTVNLSTLKVNKLTQEQYDRELANGTIDENALYLTPDDRKSVYQYAKEYGYTGTEEEFKEFFLNLGTVNEDVFLDLAIKPTTEKASYHNIQDSTDYRILDIGMDGKTEQYTTTGAQLFDISKLVTTTVNNGASITEIGENHIVITTAETYGGNGYTVTTKTLREVCPQLEVGETYLLTATTQSTRKMFYPSTVWRFGETLTMTEDVLNAKLVVYGYDAQSTGAYGACTISDIQIQKDTTALPLEKYTGGAASPNPNYPQDINNAGRYNAESGRYEIDVEICNKNLWNGEILTSFFADTKGNMQSSEENRRKYRSLIMSVPQGSYTISTSEKCRYVRFLENNTLSFITVANTNAYTFTTVGGVVGLSFRKEDNSDWDDSITIQVEYSTGATPYIQHKKQSITLSSDRPITKWDRLEKRNGAYGWVYKGVRYIFNGSEDWVKYLSCEGFFIRNILGFSAYKRDGYSNQAIVNGKDKDIMWLGQSNAYLYLAYSRFYDASLEDYGITNLKSHLNENPLEVWTYTDAEEFVPLLDEEQELLKNLETYYGVTNIMNDQDCITQIRYVADTKTFIDNEFNALQSAIVMS